MAKKDEKADKKGGKSKKDVSPEDVMGTGEIKKFFKQIKQDGAKELSVALCVAEASDEAVMMLAKGESKGPKALSREMKTAAEKAGLEIDDRTIRFGKASLQGGGDDFDNEDESKRPVLLLMLNKEVTATIHKAVLRRVKTAKFKEVDYERTDPSLENEGEAGAAPAPQQQQPTAAPPAPPPPPPPPQGEAAKLDVAALTKRLSGLVEKIPAAAGGDAARQAELMGLARQAGALLKTGSPNNAALVMDDLEARLGVGGSSAGLHGTLSAAKIEKSRMAWEAARARIVSEVEALKNAVADAFKGDEHEAQVTTALKQLDEIPRALDTKLLDSLDRLKAEQDAESQTRLTQEAQQLLAGYQNFAKSNQVFPKLAGATPFGITLTIAPVADSTFRALQASLH